MQVPIIDQNIIGMLGLLVLGTVSLGSFPKIPRTWWSSLKTFLNTTLDDIITDLNTAIQSSEKGAPNGVATLDANSKLTPSQLPNLAITNIINSAQNTLAGYIAEEWEAGVIQVSDVVQITTADESIELWMLFQNDGDEEADYKKIDASKIDWANVLNKPNLEEQKQQTVTVAKAGGQFTSIQAAIDSIADASASKIYTVLVYPGEYDEQIILKNYVNIVAVDPKSTKILQQVTDNNVECHCYLKITIESASGRGLRTQDANTVVKVDGDISSSASEGVYCGGGIQIINGDVSSSATAGVFCLGGTQTINGNVSSSVGVGADCEGGIQTINGNVSSSASSGVSCSDGTQTINGNIESTYNNAEGHGVIISSGTFIQRNGTIYVTHVDAYAIYAFSARQVKLMGVYSNRDLCSDVTNLISGGFTFDSDVE